MMLLLLGHDGPYILDVDLLDTRVVGHCRFLRTVKLQLGER